MAANYFAFEDSSGDSDVVLNGCYDVDDIHAAIAGLEVVESEDCPHSHFVQPLRCLAYCRPRRAREEVEALGSDEVSAANLPFEVNWIG